MFFAKLFGVRVEKFFVFFDIAIGKWKGMLFKWKSPKSKTTYGIGWLPLGGYCKISGMIDESFDTKQMERAPQPWEFRVKPAWQRLLIMLGGVLVNFVLALFIYSMIMFTWGNSYFKVPSMTMGMQFNAQAKSMGFKDKDIMLDTDKGPFKEYANVNGDFFRQIAQAKYVDVLREGQRKRINMPGDIDMLSMVKVRPFFAEPYIPARIDTVINNSPAMKAGIKQGDLLTSINGKKVRTWADMNYQIGILSDIATVKNTHKDSLSIRNILLTVKRNKTNKIDTIRMQLDPQLMMGVGQSSLLTYYKPVKVEYSFFESFPAGIKYGLNILSGYVSNFKYLASADGAKSLGGFASIGKMFPPYWDWYMFWNMTAFFSIILAFMNILPIPVLDGGHVMFLLYEMITRRKPSEKFMIRAQYVGFTILILLMLVANLNDVLRLLHII